ncbi:MAG TPA: hypothetical protein VFK40_09630 [Nitrososphaeraceae archaeon]|nr:hypothetical protein [Nitrososphaeraceae archaeon]
MKQELLKRNYLIVITFVCSLLFFSITIESSDAIKDNNDVQEDFDFIFDPGDYIGDEVEENTDNNNNNNLNNEDNFVQNQPVEPPTKKNENEHKSTIKKTNNNDKITSTNSEDTYTEDDDIDLENKVLVKARINLANLEKQGFLRIAAYINGQEVIKNITLDKLDESKHTLNVNLAVNKETSFLKAGDRDEFFVCAYHVKDLTKEYNTLTYFDCDEGDLLGPDKPTITRLFSPSSLVYRDSENVFNNSSSKYSQLLSTNSHETNKPNLEEEKDDSVQLKIYSPMEDRKNTQKLKITAMIKGQIKSVIIDDVQEEFNKIGGYTISRTFTFDRNTDIGRIQVGDRYHACVSSTDLNPPEGQECEKRIIKNIERPNVLYAR